VSKNLLLIILILIIASFNIEAKGKTPLMFGLNWGSTFFDVLDKISMKDVGLSPMKHYPISKGRGETDDLKLSGYVKYQSEGTPFFDIPSTVIFTFFNPSGSKNRLFLSKIEVYLDRRDVSKIPIDIRATFRNLIMVFCENYNIKLKFDEERILFSNYSYQTTVNGVFVNFFANTETISFNKRDAIYLSYENNEYQRLIVAKDNELNNKGVVDDSERRSSSDVKKNL